MSEPNIIRSDRPHEVTIPEGSNKALAKTATQQEPSVRKVMREEGGEQVEEILPDKFVSVTPDELETRPDQFAHDTSQRQDTVAKTAVVTEENRVKIPGEVITTNAPLAIPPALERDIPKLPEVAVSPVEVVAPTQVSAPATESFMVRPPALAAAPQSPMLEMDFPARIVHLRIENQKIQKRLDELEADD